MGVNIFGLWTAKGLRMLLGIKNARSWVGATLATSLATCAIRGESPGLLRPNKNGHTVFHCVRSPKMSSGGCPQSDIRAVKFPFACPVSPGNSLMPAQRSGRAWLG
jgi:hypothetical protein